MLLAIVAADTPIAMWNGNAQHKYINILVFKRGNDNIKKAQQ